MEPKPPAGHEQPPIVLTTDIPGLTLRELLPADMTAWISHVDRNRAHLSEFGADTLPPHTPEAVSEWLAGSRDADIRMGMWLGDELIGFVGLTHLSHAIGGAKLLRRSPDGWVLGYGIASRYTRRGFTVAACRSLMAYAVSSLGATDFWSSARAGNVPSVRVLERLGFSIYKQSSESVGYRLKADERTW